MEQVIPNLEKFPVVQKTGVPNNTYRMKKLAWTALQKNGNSSEGDKEIRKMKIPRATGTGICLNTFFLNKKKLESPTGSFSNSPYHPCRYNWCLAVITITMINENLLLPPEPVVESETTRSTECDISTGSTQLSNICQYWIIITFHQTVLCSLG